jgi:hypothetical protein
VDTFGIPMRGAIDLAFFHFVSVVGFNAYIARLRDKHEVPLQLDQYQRQPEITATCRHNTTDSAAYNPSTTNKPASHLVSSSLPGGHLEMGIGRSWKEQPWLPSRSYPG